MVRIDGDLHPESGEAVLTALGAVMDAETKGRRHPGTGTDTDPETRTPAQRRADALGEVCRQWLDRRDRPMLGGERPHLSVTISLEELRASGVGALDHTGAIGGERLRRLACDASVMRIVMAGDSQPLDLGRRTPVVSASIRRAVIARDRHCRFPGCDRPPSWCDCHHVRHWIQGGPTEPWNLLLLCRRHHRLVHERGKGGFGLQHVSGRPVFTRPDGSVIEDRGPP